MKVRRFHPRRAIVEVDRHAAALILVGGAVTLAVLAVGPKRDRPEQATRVGMNPGVEVVNLGGEVLEVEPTSVEVQSNESERPSVNGAVLADVDTLHKTHIGVEEECLDAAVGMLGDALSSHVCDADEAFEVGDRGRVHPGSEGGEVESDPVDSGCGGRRLGCSLGERCCRSSGRPE